MISFFLALGPFENKAIALQLGFGSTHPRFQDGRDNIEDISLNQPDYIAFLNAVDLGALQVSEIRYQIFYDTKELSIEAIDPDPNDVLVSSWSKISNGLFQINHQSKAAFVNGFVQLDNLFFSSINGREVLVDDGISDYKIFNFAWKGLGPLWVEEPWKLDLVEVQPVPAVPAPFPVMGVGVFWCYLRKLRRRLDSKKVSSSIHHDIN